MKTNRLEELFQDKFRDYRVEPSERARDLFESRLSSRRRKLWLKNLSIAASILILALVGITITLQNNSESIRSGDRSNIVEGTITTPSLSVERVQITDNNTKTPESESMVSIKKEKQDDVIAFEEGSPQVVSKESDFIIEPLNSPTEIMEIQPLVTLEETGVTLFEDSVTKDMPESRSDHEKESVAEANNSGEIDNGKKPVKITIEYIAGNSRNGNSKDKKMNMKEFYGKVNDLLYPDEVLGDIRALKDQLFALEFKNEKRSETQNKEKQ